METIKLAKRILDELNKNKVSCKIITRKLSEKVQLAKVWTLPLSPKETVYPLQGYFLKEREQYIGLVLEEEDGLLAYMLPAYRKNSYMSTALRQVILPHLLQQKPIIRLKISAAKLGGERLMNTAKKIALAVGFEVLKEEPGSSIRLAMDASGLKERPFIKGENERLSKERLATLKKQITYAASVLSVVQTELEYKRGISGYSDELGDWIKGLFSHAEKLENAWFERK